MTTQNRHAFLTTTGGEPHARRHVELLSRHPEIKQLFGYDRRTAWTTPFVVAAQLCVAGAVGAQARSGAVLGRWWAVALLAWGVGAVLTHWLAMAIHETSHRLAARTRQGNTAIALLANVPLVLPLALSFNRYHLEHHRALDVQGVDVDLPLEWELNAIGDSPLRKGVWVIVHPLIALIRARTYAKAPTRGELLNVALVVAVDALIVWSFGPAALAYLALSFLFAFGLHPLAAHFLHEHYPVAGRQETFSYYGPLNRIALNVGHHHEHHDFTNVSGWRLPRLTALVPEYRQLSSHASWFAVLWRFIADRSLPYGKRLVRTREDFQHGRSDLRRRRAQGAR